MPLLREPGDLIIIFLFSTLYLDVSDVELGLVSDYRSGYIT